MKHWTEEELTQWVYGLTSDAGHLKECAECREQAEAAVARRKTVIEPPEVSWEFLAAQRRAIYRRMSQREPVWFRPGGLLR